jgi:aldehyde:ferredoxin oxidoreductase
LSTDGKAELVARFQDAFALIDSGGVCVFLRHPLCFYQRDDDLA